MTRLTLLAATAALSLSAVAATAANYTANPTNFVAVFAEAQSGDTITLTGSFGAVTLADRSFAVPVRIDASAATFSDTLSITDVSGLAFTGGRYGSATRATGDNAAVSADSDSNISFDKAYVVGALTGTGIRFSDSTNVKVTGSTFKGLHSGIDVSGSTGAVLDNNHSISAAADGFDIADSHFVSVTNSTCASGTPTAGSHSDCVQLYSKLGNPVQSDIAIVGNYATGPTQGFSSFDPSLGGGLNIIINHNIVVTSDPQGIACYACVDSIFTNNTLTTLPGAQYQTGMSINGGSNNFVYGNTISGAPAADNNTLADTQPLTSDSLIQLGFSPTAFAALFAAILPGTADPTALTADVPEPSAWAMMIAGFGLIGGMARRRSRLVAA